VVTVRRSVVEAKVTSRSSVRFCGFGDRVGASRLWGRLPKSKCC